MGALLAKGKANDCSNPAVQVFFAQAGFLVNPVKVEFQVFRIAKDREKISPVQVFPTSVGTKELMDLAACPTGSQISPGHFAPQFTLGKAPGLHEIRYFVTYVTAGAVFEVVRQFELVNNDINTPFLGYCFPSDIRDEGFEGADPTDARLYRLIQRESRFIENATQRIFVPQVKSFKVDGVQGRDVLLDLPIITVEKVTILDPVLIATIADEIDRDAYRVFNRHLTQQLYTPDDRENPRIAFLRVDDQFGVPPRASSDLLLRNREVFPLGVQNVQIDGVFGYTDPDVLRPGDQIGITPDLIREVCVKLVIRNKGKMKNTDDREDAQRRHRLVSEKTLEQSYTLTPEHLKGFITGDSDIDNVLIQFKRPLQIGVA